MKIKALNQNRTHKHERNKKIPQNKKTELINLKRKITAARKELYTLWSTHGCTNSEVLAASIELDQLLNEYTRLLRK